MNEEEKFEWENVVDKLLNRIEKEEIKWVLWDYEMELNSWRKDKKKIDELS